MEALLKKQVAIAKQISQAIINFKKTGETRRTTNYLQARITQAKELFDMFSTNHQEIFSMDSDPSKNHEYIKDDVYAATEEAYFNYLDDLQNLLDKKQPNLEHTEVKTEVQLPRINLPKFDGSYSNWRAFHDLFTSLIHQDTRVPDVQKLHYLKASLCGEAERLIKKFTTIAANYQPAWELLEKRYNNKRILVNNHLKELCNQLPIRVETADSIKKLMDNTSERLNELEALGVSTQNWDTIIIHMMIQHLPAETHNLWEQTLGSTQELPTLQQFMDFLEARYRTLEAVTGTRPTKHLRKSSGNTTSLTHHSLQSSNCPLCKDIHKLYECSDFRKMGIAQRRNITTKNNLCYNCLGTNHTTSSCKSKHKCFKCGKKHHSLLHVDNDTSKSKHTSSHRTSTQNIHHEGTDSSPAFTSPNAQSTSVNTQINACKFQALLATALVNVETSSGHSLMLRALIDPGSQVNIISEQAYRKLHLKANATEVQINGLGKSKTATATRAVEFTLKSLNSSAFQLHTNALVLKHITDILPPNRLKWQSWEHIKGLQLADPTFTQPGKVDLLLGAEVYANILLEGIRKCTTPGSPTAQNTSLGWILFGTTTNGEQTQSVFTLSIEDNLLKLENQLRKFWEWEDMPKTRTWTSDEIECEEFYIQTYKRRPDGTYEVRLPFKNKQPPILGNSRNMAIKRFMHLEKKLSMNPQLHDDYSRVIKEYQTLNHMKPLAINKLDGVYTEPIKHFYMPHHAVFKESSTTKLRVVFDASAKSSNGKSLNQQLLTGPTLQPTLLATLLKWRKFEYSLSADIEKMYRMIHLHEDDQPYQRIIWRNKPNEPLQEFALTTVTFGTAAAPFLAIRTLQQLAKDDQHKYPRASRIIMENSYVDDVLTGADTIEETIQIQKELTNLLKGGGFKLRKWTSNHPKILEDVPPEDREITFPLSFKDEENIKALGIHWHPSTDEFSFKINIRETHGTLTKRKVLSEISQLFDPLGWLAPAVIAAKIMIQKLWLSGLTWDEPVPSELSNEWKYFKENLPSIQEIRIPRWINLKSSQQSCQLHGFCDASMQAYAAVVYIRIIDLEGRIHTKLLISKSRVAPIKTISLPRLELCAALLLIKLLNSVRKDMDLSNIPSYSWTDSKITLSWIKGHPSRWKTFIANRVAEIQEHGRLNSWHHVPSKENPADCASRGLTPSALVNNELWFHGPTWLRKEQSSWPTITWEVSKEELEEEQRTKSLIATNLDSQEFITRFSSYNRLIRVLSWCLRFSQNCKKMKRTGPLTAEEVQETERRLIRTVQAAEFPDDIKQLSCQREISNHSRIKSLNPYLSTDGILRVGGRLANAEVSYNQQHPIILPKSNHFSNLLIDMHHKRSLHGGTQMTLNSIRNKYWIIDGRNAVRFRISKCIICIRHRGKTQTQIMSDLPAPRVNPSHPFNNCGIDFAGPIDIRMSKHRGAKTYKGYFCIFICLSTKAIHIEAVSDLTSTAFIAAFKRFIGRRGLCSHIYSDCGTNLIGANKLLKKDRQDTIRNANINWIGLERSNRRKRTIQLRDGRNVGIKLVTRELQATTGECKIIHKFEIMWFNLR